ncbi:hypothetical protein PAEPH01_0884 [Pancytospora epiphaga]|nr:hypothetical protein PAEPH01_0884 [Pancytospora epiphaga]
MDLRKPTLEEIKPLLTIAGVILNTADLVSKGVPPSFLDILLPSLATTYGSGIVTSSITKSFSITPQSFVIYLIGLVLSLYVYNNRLFLCLISEAPMVSKLLSSIELAKSDKDTWNIIVCCVLGHFTGALIKKLVLRRSMKLKKTDIFGLILYTAGLYTIRQYHLPPLSVFFIVYPIPLSDRLRKYFSSRKRTEEYAEKINRPIENTPIAKLPRRKASISSQLNVKNKKS